MAILSFSLWVGCEKAIDELEDTAHQSRPFTEVMTVTVEVKIDDSPMEAAQAVLGEYADTMSDIWKWIDGDVAYVKADIKVKDLYNNHSFYTTAGWNFNYYINNTIHNFMVVTRKKGFLGLLTHELGHAISVNADSKEFWKEIDKVHGEYLSNITC